MKRYTSRARGSRYARSLKRSDARSRRLVRRLRRGRRRR